MAFGTNNTVIKISDMRYRVALCTQDDVVVDGATMELQRKAVRWTWAYVEHQSHLSSFLSRVGYASEENVQRPTHKIWVRAQHDLDYAATAWVYETRLKSPPRWYKFLGFVEKENFVCLECHLVERNEDARPTDEPACPAPGLGPAKQDVVL